MADIKTQPGGGSPLSIGDDTTTGEPKNGPAGPYITDKDDGSGTPGPPGTGDRDAPPPDIREPKAPEPAIKEPPVKKNG